MSPVVDSYTLKSVSHLSAPFQSTFNFRIRRRFICRVCSCLKHRGCLIVPKALNRPYISMRGFNSYEPQEANLDTKEVGKDNFLIDCGPDQECVFGGIVALGKFDALHIGHRELAIQASKVGTPFLLSFVGMAEVLGWENRAPIVAKCDRKRVLSLWAPLCGNVVPLEYHVEFLNVRHLTPRQFVEKLSRELGISGVVAGENYRFGYKASGDASELVRLCKEYGLGAYIVSSVMDKSRCLTNGGSTGPDLRDRGQVSSTRVRHALAAGDMKYVSELLGRNHRLMLTMDPGHVGVWSNRLSAPKLCLLNQPPRDGSYSHCALTIADTFVGYCDIIIDATHVHVELNAGFEWGLCRDHQLMGIEFDGMGDGSKNGTCLPSEAL